MRSSLLSTGFAALAIASTAACGDGSDGYDNKAACAEQCKSGGAPASSSTTTSTPTADGGITVNVKVIVLDDPTFAHRRHYGGSAVVEAEAEGGKWKTWPYPKGTSSEPLTGLAGGHGMWMLAHAESSTGLLPTFSMQTVVWGDAIDLPMIDRGAIAAVLASRPTPSTVDATKAQVILRFLRNDKTPTAGVSLGQPVPGATVLYDHGAAAYGSAPTATGSAGTILILNVPASTNGGSLAIDVVDKLATGGPKTQQYTLSTRSGSATFAAVPLF